MTDVSMLQSACTHISVDAHVRVDLAVAVHNPSRPLHKRILNLNRHDLFLSKVQRRVLHRAFKNIGLLSACAQMLSLHVLRRLMQMMPTEVCVAVCGSDNGEGHVAGLVPVGDKGPVAAAVLSILLGKWQTLKLNGKKKN